MLSPVQSVGERGRKPSVHPRPMIQGVSRRTRLARRSGRYRWWLLGLVLVLATEWNFGRGWHGTSSRNDWAEERARLREMGYPARLDELVEATSPEPGQVEPARRLIRLVETLRRDLEHDGGYDVLRRAMQGFPAIPDDARDEASALVAAHADSLAELRELLPQAGDRFSRFSADGRFRRTPDGFSFRVAAEMLGIRSVLAVDARRPKGITRDLRDLFFLERDVEAFRTAGGLIISLSIGDLALRLLEHGLSAGVGDAAELEALSRMLVDRDRSNRTARMLAAELCEVWASMAAGPRFMLGVVERRRPGEFAFQARLRQATRAVMADGYAAMGYYGEDEEFYTDRMMAYLEAALAEPGQRQAMMNGALQETQRLQKAYGRRQWLLGTILGSHARLVGQELKLEGRLQGARVALAVEAYRLAEGGSLPVEVGELIPRFLAMKPVDAASGRPLVTETRLRGYAVTVASGTCAGDPGVGEVSPWDVFAVSR